MSRKMRPRGAVFQDGCHTRMRRPLTWKTTLDGQKKKCVISTSTLTLMTILRRSSSLTLVLPPYEVK